jgi:hypothetical protein
MQIISTTHSPLVEPDVRISLIRLSQRLRLSQAQATPSGGRYKYTKPMRLKCS